MRTPHRSRRSILQAASLAAGGFFLPAQAQSKTETATPLNRIRIASYNAQNYRLTDFVDPLTEGTTKAKTLESREAMAKLLARLKPDVLGLCEMGDENSLADLQQRLAAEGWELPGRELLAGSDPARHAALLTRLPIIARHHNPVPEFVMGAQRRVMARGILDVELDAGQGLILRLVGVHLKSRRDMSDGDQALARRNEAHLLRKHIETALKEAPDSPLIVFGDFNDHKDSPSLREIISAHDAPRAMAPLPLEDTNGHRWTYHYPETDEYSRIDFLLGSPAAHTMLDHDESGIYSGKDWRLASDHRPIYATLRRRR